MRASARAHASMAVELNSSLDTAILPLQSAPPFGASGAFPLSLENPIERVIIPHRRTYFRIRDPRREISSFVAKSMQGKSTKLFRNFGIRNGSFG